MILALGKMLKSYGRDLFRHNLVQNIQLPEAMLKPQLLSDGKGSETS